MNRSIIAITTVLSTGSALAHPGHADLTQGWLHAISFASHWPYLLLLAGAAVLPVAMYRRWRAVWRPQAKSQKRQDQRG